jgi:hypothetical protein
VHTKHVWLLLSFAYCNQFNKDGKTSFHPVLQNIMFGYCYHLLIVISLTNTVRHHFILCHYVSLLSLFRLSDQLLTWLKVITLRKVYCNCTSGCGVAYR